MSQPTWTDHTQRCVLRAALEGEFGKDPGILEPGLFTGDRRILAHQARDFHQSHGRWPDAEILKDLCPEQKVEAAKLGLLNGSKVPFGAEMGRTVMRRIALDHFVRDAEVAIAEGPDSWKHLEAGLRKALRTAGGAVEATEYLDGVQSRQEDENLSEGFVRAPTGVPALDRAMRGGLGSGEQGFILGQTKLGKSHLAVSFASESLRAGVPVLFFSLELRLLQLGRRFDRNLSGLTMDESLDRPQEVYARVREAVGPGMLRLVCVPRFSQTVHAVEDQLKEALDAWGRPGLLVVDYGSILKHTYQGRPDEQIGRTHEYLSSMLQKHECPGWVPYQTNRRALEIAAGESVHEGHAGASFESMQHADVILSVTPAGQESLVLTMDAVRDYEGCTAKVKKDWARSRVEPWKELE